MTEYREGGLLFSFEFCTVEIIEYDNGFVRGCYLLFSFEFCSNSGRLKYVDIVAISDLLFSFEFCASVEG